MWYGQPRVPICLALTMGLLMRAIPQRYCWGDSTASTASHASPTPGSSIRATTDSSSTDATKSWFLEISDPTQQDFKFNNRLEHLRSLASPLIRGRIKACHMRLRNSKRNNGSRLTETIDGLNFCQGCK